MLHGTRRNMYCWEMLASYLYKGNYGHMQILLFFVMVQVWSISLESEGIYAAGKCPHYAFIKIKLRGNYQILKFVL